jgi:hypothetical protein
MPASAVARAQSLLAGVTTVVDIDALFAVSRGETYVMGLGAGREVRLSGDRVLAGADGTRTWIGAVVDGTADERAYITELDGHVYGRIATSATSYEVIARPGQGAVVRDLAEMGMTRKLALRDDALVPPVLGSPILAPDRDTDFGKATPTPQVTIDLMIVYTAALAARYGAGAGVATRINNLIAQANDSYARSEVAITLNLVRSEQTTYTNSNDNNTALDAITNGTGVFSSVAATRNTYAADLVALLRPYDDATHTGCGLAWIGGFGQTTPLSAYGYAVISEGSDLGGSGYLCLESTFQHELGHNMGLMHDRATVLASNAGVIKYGATSYGFGYIITGTSPSVGDIMSYAARGVNCFSSPTVFRQGPGSGLSGGSCGFSPATGDVLGVPSSNAASSADAAAALNFIRVAIANFRTPAASASISGVVANGAGIAGVTFCARPSAGVSCTASNASGAYSCTVPSGWTGLLHSPTVAGNRIPVQVFSSSVTGATTRNVTARPDASFGCNLDVDNNGLLEPAIDGVAILRRMYGFGQNTLTGLSGACAQNTAASALFAAANPANFNVTGGSSVLPATDGLLLLRAMQGSSGAAITAGLGLASEAGATRTVWGTGSDGQIRAWLNTTCGTDF